MKILVINCGSSSIKYQLFHYPGSNPIAKGLIESVGQPGSAIKDHHQGMSLVFKQLLEGKVIDDLQAIDAIGHRVVHGGQAFRQPHLIDAAVLKKIKDNCRLAPLHNPANLAGIKATKRLLPKAPQVAVFDTAFHQTIPDYAFMYPVPRKYFTKNGVRKYGFHGTSHQYVAQAAARCLKKPIGTLKIITCHLGNGCSITAIDRGKSVDTSMGLTPLEGLMMGTRSGDVDPALIPFLMRQEGLSAEEADSILNKKSGLLGISGVSNDFRLVVSAANKGNRWARLALTMYTYRIKKYIGAYALALGGVDAVCFAGGVGENNRQIVSRLKKTIVKVLGRSVEVLVIPTNEELMIASLSYGVVQKAYRLRPGSKRR